MSRDVSMHTRLGSFLALLVLCIGVISIVLGILVVDTVARYCCFACAALMVFAYVSAIEATLVGSMFFPLTRLGVVRLGFSSLFSRAFWRYAWEGFSYKGAFSALLLLASGVFVGWALRK